MLIAREGIKVSIPTASLRTSPLSLLRLKLAAGTFSDETVLADRPAATRGYDAAFDAAKMMNPALNIYSEATTAAPMAISSVNLTENDTIALKLSSASTQTATLTAADLSDFTDKFNLFIRDEATGQVSPLTATGSLSFGLSAGKAYPLTLLLKPAGITAFSKAIKTPVNLYPNPGKGSLTLTAGGAELTGLAITDPSGRLVYSQSLSGFSQSIDTRLPAGMYITRITLTNGSRVLKYVVE